MTNDLDRVVTASAPAKVNLTLACGPLRADGFHELATTFMAVDLRDVVQVRPAASNFSCRVRTARDGIVVDGVPQDDSNLVIKAAKALAAQSPSWCPVDFEIAKSIPVAAGMAGGSADAAAALIACRELWQSPVSDAALRDLAAQLGSDVPFAMLGGVATGFGRGEQLTAIDVPHISTDWVFAVSQSALSTPKVFAALDSLRAEQVVPTPAVPSGLHAALHSGDPAELASVMANDLQPAAIALQPDLADLIAYAHTDPNVLAAQVSGSGPTVAYLCPSQEAAQTVAKTVADLPGVRAAYTLTGPVPGARLDQNSLQRTA